MLLGIKIIKEDFIYKEVNNMGRLVDEHPELITEWDYERNDGLNPKDFTSGSNKKVFWCCNKGHKWDATIKNRCMRESGCPYCAGKRAWPGYNDLATTHPELAAQWDYSENGKLTPKDVTAGSGKSIGWICDKGHKWKATPNDRVTKNTGCPVCSGKKVLAGYNDLATTYPEIAAQWHPTGNGKLTPRDVTAGSHKTVKWLCDKGHDWDAVVKNRTIGKQGCPYCTGRRAWPGYNDLATVNPELAAQWHPTKNGNLKPKDVTAGSNKKVYWICNFGHTWQAKISERNNGTDCPICDSESRTSLPEQTLYFYLNKVTQAKNRYKANDKYEIDIYLPEFKTGIEYDGYYWHKGEAASRKENKKDQDLFELGIRIIRIKELKIPDPMLVDTNDIIYCTYANDLSYLADVIRKICNILDISEFIDIDINRDRTKIYEQYVTSRKYNSIAQMYPELLKEWHPTKNDQLDPETISYSSSKLIWWLCKKGHSWQAAPSYRISNNSGCPYCAGKRAWPGYNDLATTHPKLAAQWDYTENGKLTPKDITAGSGKSIGWICDKGHKWKATPNDRISKNTGCPICSGKKVLAGYNDLATIYPEIAAQWHPIKNGNLTPQEVTAGSGKTVWWLCDKGHDWRATVTERTARGNACPYCSGHRVWKGFNDLATTNPELAAQWHPTLNGDLQPEDVSKGSKRKVWWICDEGHEWKATIKERVYGTGCPTCWKSHKRSQA